MVMIYWKVSSRIFWLISRFKCSWTNSQEKPQPSRRRQVRPTSTKKKATKTGGGGGGVFAAMMADSDSD